MIFIWVTRYAVTYGAAILFLFLQASCSNLDAHPNHLHEHPIGAMEFEWTAQHIRRASFISLDIQPNIWVVAAANTPRIVTFNDRRCLVGSSFMFDVDDSFAFDIDEDVTLEILTIDKGDAGFFVSYDHATTSPPSLIVHPFSEDNGFARASIKLERARFANRRLLYGDILIASLGSVMIAQSGELTSPGANSEIVICDLHLIRSPSLTHATGDTGYLSMRVRDATGSATAARVGLYDEQGRLPIPSDMAIAIPIFNETYRQMLLPDGLEAWPAPGRFVFHVNGQYNAPLPAGTYDVIIGKGPEYRLHRTTVQVKPGESSVIEIQLDRWIDMPGSGWYSGDGHIHINRDPDSNKSISAFMQAQDIHVANLLQMNNLSNSYFRQYAFGEIGQYRDGDHILVSGQESPRSFDLGHRSALNIQSKMPSSRFFGSGDIARAAQADGGLFGFMHAAIKFGGIDKGMALEVPLGIGDIVETLQFGVLDTTLMEDFLNLGYRLTPVSGSDYPYLSPPGFDRTYVKIDGPLTAQAWFDNLRQGRSFVTTGPMIEFEVNGKPVGSDVTINKGEPVTIVVRARVNPDVDELQHVELLAHGEVLRKVHAMEPTQILSLEHSFVPTDSLWLMAKAQGSTTHAHTAATFVIVDGDYWTGNRSLARELAMRYQSLVLSIKDHSPSYLSQAERWDFTEEELLNQWNDELPQLNEMIDAAADRYRTLLDSLE